MTAATLTPTDPRALDDCAHGFIRRTCRACAADDPSARYAEIISVSEGLLRAWRIIECAQRARAAGKVARAHRLARLARKVAGLDPAGG